MRRGTSHDYLTLPLYVFVYKSASAGTHGGRRAECEGNFQQEIYLGPAEVLLEANMLFAMPITWPYLALIPTIANS
jgi:hypothetical protein